MGKTPPLLIVRNEVVCNIESYTGVWVGRTPLFLMGGVKWLATFGVMHRSLGE